MAQGRKFPVKEFKSCVPMLAASYSFTTRHSGQFGDLIVTREVLVAFLPDRMPCGATQLAVHKVVRVLPWSYTVSLRRSLLPPMPTCGSST